ncbi:hypothetical protein ILYODFUR_015490 [Ilyodon furcidens]|uniref:Uncharacterized protein n=1 Tax=Ilyodon furcidens TaxID=33524 RepID=A0ABV0TIX4_9TELE
MDGLNASLTALLQGSGNVITVQQKKKKGYSTYFMIPSSSTSPNRKYRHFQRAGPEADIWADRRFWTNYYTRNPLVKSKSLCMSTGSFRK